MDLPVLVDLATLGVGGVLAYVVFHFYRKDQLDHIQQIKEMSARWEYMSQSWMRVVQENTAAITVLTSKIEE